MFSWRLKLSQSCQHWSHTSHGILKKHNLIHKPFTNRYNCKSSHHQNFKISKKTAAKQTDHIKEEVNTFIRCHPNLLCSTDIYKPRYGKHDLIDLFFQNWHRSTRIPERTMYKIKVKWLSACKQTEKPVNWRRFQIKYEKFTVDWKIQRCLVTNKNLDIIHVSAIKQIQDLPTFPHDIGNINNN